MLDVSDEQSSIWRCTQIEALISSHIRASFSFLASSTLSFERPERILRVDSRVNS